MLKIKLTDQTEMQIYVAKGEGKSLPGLLLFQEAFGVNEHIRSVADRLAAEGYIVYAPELYHRTAGDGFSCAYSDFEKVAMPHYLATTRETLSVDLKGSFEALKKDSQVDPDRIGAIGFCLGGKVAFVANAILPLQAAVSFYGGGIASEMIDLADQQNGPLFLAWGGKDDHISQEDRRKISGALSRAKKPYIEIVFSDAGHGFFCDQRPSYHADSATMAWGLTKAFFTRYLGKS